METGNLYNKEVANTKRKKSVLFEQQNELEEMGPLLSSSCHIRTPKSAKKNARMPRRSASKGSTGKKKSKTPSKPVENAIVTPSKYNLRQRMKQELASLNSAAIDSDPEDSDENKSWDEESDSECVPDENFTLTPSSSTSKKGKDNSINPFAEDYFSAQKKAKSVTSNRTLSKVNFKQIDIEELNSILYNIPENHKKEKNSLVQYYASLFKKWIFLLQEGFNVMLYGIGSKQKILQRFCKEFLEDSVYVVIHGFFPSVNIKQILCTITEDALDCEDKFANVYEHAEYIKNHFLKSKTDLYVIIHNIDASTLRGEKNQTIFALLAAVPKIHFVASVDHINCSLIWDQIMLSQFKWVWFDCTTFEPYIAETSYENNILRDQSTHLFLSSLLHVYHSLTPNGQGVFLILAKHQNSGKDTSNFLGITFPEWYQQCREAFLVNSELTMQAQLSEFKNHKLLSFRKSPDSIEHWYIPVDSATLEQFLESCE